MVLKYGLEWLFLLNNFGDGLYRGYDDGIIYCLSDPDWVNNFAQKSKVSFRFKNPASGY